MAIVQQKVSDLSGQAAPDNAMASVVVRHHPKFQDAKTLDVLVTELEALKPVTDLVMIEVRMPDTSTRELQVKYTDFAKWATDEVVNAARGTRGRVPGTKLS